MEWYHYVACFFSGAFSANVVPHFVAGIQGNKFPTPFAKPPGKGLSSPTLNVVWALFNLIMAALLFRSGKVGTGAHLSLLIYLAGIAAMSIGLSKRFQEKHRE